MTSPERTCVGCGRKGLQTELVRFTAEAGALVPGRLNPGRGAYTCRRLACFERAVDRRSFARVLRHTVSVDLGSIDPALARLYTGA